MKYILSALLLLTACTPDPRVIETIIETQQGDHRFLLEVAESDAERARGLMYRTQLADNGGMVFFQAQEQDMTMWMKNTLIPLDMLFVGRDGRIRLIAEAKPHDETPIGEGVPVMAVVEIKGGRAAALGIRKGDIVRFLAPLKP